MLGLDAGRIGTLEVELKRVNSTRRPAEAPGNAAQTVESLQTVAFNRTFDALNVNLLQEISTLKKDSAAAEKLAKQLDVTNASNFILLFET